MTAWYIYGISVVFLGTTAVQEYTLRMTSTWNIFVKRHDGKTVTIHLDGDSAKVNSIRQLLAMVVRCIANTGISHLNYSCIPSYLLKIDVASFSHKPSVNTHTITS